MPLNMRKAAAFDVETKGVYDKQHALQPFRLRTGEAKLTSSAMAWLGADGLKAKAWQSPSRDLHEKVLRHAVDKGITLIAWNAKFDAAWLCAQGLTDLVMKAKWLDGMLLWQHLERGPEYFTSRQHKKPWSLKSAVATYFPQYEGYDEGIDFDSEEPEMVAKRMRYNKLDTIFTLRLAQMFYAQLEEEGPQRIRNALIEADTIPLVADRTVQGLSVNKQASIALGKVLEGRRIKLLEELSESGATPAILASSKQLQQLVYEEWGLPIVKKTDKGAPSTDKEAIYMLSPLDDRAPKIQEYRESSLNRKKFVTNVLNSLDYNGDGKTRPEMRIYGTYTGRASYSSTQGENKDKVQTGFALHQMKNDKDFRRPIVAPPGYVIIEWDAASQEYRWMGTESGDEVMLSLCLPGEDPHAFMGANIGHVEYRWVQKHKDDDDDAYRIRKGGKVGNLSCQYRIGYKTLRVRANVQHQLPIDNKEAKLIHRTYHSTYKGVEQYWRRQINKCRRLGYAETLAGRRVQLTGQWSHPQEGWKLESTAVNFPIQGIGADQKYLAMKILKNVLPQVGGHFYFELHDGLYAILPERTALRDGLKIRDMLSHMPYQKAWGFTPPIPMPWDMKIGPNWGDLKEVSE